MSGETGTTHVPRRSTQGGVPDTPRSTEPDGYDFQFVEVGGLTKGDEEARSVIRAHVMRDFYGKRRQGKEPNCQAEIISAASSREGVSQQARRFKNGPRGLQELVKKQKKQGRLPHKTETSPPLVTPCITLRGSISATPSPHSLFAEGQHSPLTLSSNFEAQSQDLSGDELRGQGNTSYSGSRDQPNRSGSLTSVLGSWDPFNALPIPNDPRTQTLIYYANNGILASPLMGQLRTEWLNLATKDLALFHICLSHYAGNYGLAKQESDPTDALRLRMQSMKLVNERLEDLKTALADGTMGTVASLSSYEATNGSLTAVKTHLQGLRKMVRLRGGIHESGMNSYTARLVLWADLNCANALACDPIFPIPDCDEMNAYIKSSHDQRRSTSNPNFRAENRGGLIELLVLNKDLIDKFIDLRYLAGVNSCPGRRQSISKEEQIFRSDEVYFVERCLLTLSNLCGPRNLVTSCCIAAIIFIDNHLRGIAFIARIMTRHIARLKLSIELFLDSESSFAASSTTPRTILWTLYVGGIVAGSRPERGWFVSQLLEFCDLLELHSWEGAEAVLNNFLWPVTWDLEGLLLWECVEDARVIRQGLRSGPFNLEETADSAMELFPISYSDQRYAFSGFR